jgi:hypothetical protein
VKAQLDKFKDANSKKVEKTKNHSKKANASAFLALELLLAAQDFKAKAHQ